MELNIVDRKGKTLNAQFGISDERSAELKAKLDELVKSYGNKLVLVPACDTLSDIAAFCNSTEELMICTILHYDYHFKRGTTHVIYPKK